MKRLRLLLLAPILALAVGGCSLFPSSTTANDALTAVQAAITTYADVYQPAVLVYGHLPLCPGATLCHTQATLDKLKAVDLAATSSIKAAQSVLEGSVTDSGQLTKALGDISAAEAAIAATGVTLTPKGN